MFLSYTIYKDGHILDNVKEDIGDKDIKDVIDYLIDIREEFAKEHGFKWTRNKKGRSTEGYWLSYKYNNKNCGILE